MLTKKIRLPLLWIMMLVMIMVSCQKDDDKEEDTGILYVPGDFSTIQAAIDASFAGDEIIVDPGVYVENINFNGKEVMVQSTDPEDEDIVASTIIDGDENGSVVTFDNGESSETVLSGFTIRNGSARNGAGIFIDNGSSPVIKNNYITENICGQGGGGGAFVANNSSAEFKNNIFDNNINGRTSSRTGLALLVRDQSEATITGNVFINHEGVRGTIAIGIGSEDESSAYIYNNTIEYNTTDYGTGGIAVWGSSAVIDQNTIAHNTGGGSGIYAGGAFSVRYESEVEITGNTISDNWAEHTGAIAAGEDSWILIQNNNITRNSSGEEGTTTGSGGGIYIEESTAQIDQNQITHNTSWNTNTGGGGIYVRDAEVEITQNQILHNRANRSGGGIFLRGHGDNENLVATITDNVISHNSAEGHYQARGGGIYAGWIQQVTIHDNTLEHNYAQYRGGGIYIREEAAVYGALNAPWERVNYPPQEEIFNDYDDNDHEDPEHGGHHVFFSEIP